MRLRYTQKMSRQTFLPGLKLLPCFLFFLCFAFGFVVLVEFVEKIKISLGIDAFSCLEPVAVVVVARIVIDIGLQYLRYLQRYFLICRFITSAVFIYILPPK